MIGGVSRCAKTWLGLDMALSVATGTPCLGKYAVSEPGPVLVYLAETGFWSCENALREWPGTAESISTRWRST